MKAKGRWWVECFFGGNLCVEAGEAGGVGGV
jgi:hypothetical protein